MGIMSKLFSRGEEAVEGQCAPAAPVESSAGGPAASSGKRDTELWKQVQGVLDMIRPAIQMDGGDVELVDLGDDGTVYIAMQGHCVGCPMSQMTLQMGIERTLKGHIPEVTRVVAL